MDHIKRLFSQRQFSQALERLVNEHQDLTGEARKESLYYQAVALRYLGQLKDAADMLQLLVSEWPEYGRGFQELAHTQKALKLWDSARDNYYKAIRLNPALHASWNGAAELEIQRNHTDQAELNRQQAEFLTRQPKAVIAALNLYHEGKYYKAEKICRAFLQRQPHHIEAMRTLANIGAQLDVLNDAEFLLDSVLVLAPDYDLARFDLVKVLQRRQKYQQAYEHAEILFRKAPDNPVYKALFANLSASLDYDEQALTLYDELIDERSTEDVAGIHVAKGHLLKAIGNSSEAIKSYQKAYAERSDFGDAFWSLANLKTYRFNDDEMTKMERALASSGTYLNDRIHLCFALGRALEQSGDTDNSFHYYALGNDLKRNNSHFKPEVLARRISAQRRFFTKGTVNRLSQAKLDESVTPIFIVGLPRAGSTLLEQILAAHSAIEGTQELPTMPAIAHGLNGRQLQTDEPRYPDVLGEMNADQVTELGQRYLTETAMFRTGAAYFIDKMPNNFRHIGLIKTLLPHAKIIDARRDPMDCCFSAFKQLFAEGQEFSYGLDMLAEYYRDYVDLMTHWKGVYPGSIYTVIHENLVTDPEKEISNIFRYLDLPLENACLRSHETKRRVKTASSEQVREPINSKGLGQWKRFEKHLSPLKQALGSGLLESWDQR